MVRTQVQLTDEQAQRLRQLAAERAESMAAVIREAVDDLLGAEGGDSWERALRAVGSAGTDTATDVSARHDEYLAEAREADLR